MMRATCAVCSFTIAQRFDHVPTRVALDRHPLIGSPRQLVQVPAYGQQLQVRARQALEFLLAELG